MVVGRKNPGANSAASDAGDTGEPLQASDLMRSRGHRLRATNAAALLSSLTLLMHDNASCACGVCSDFATGQTCMLHCACNVCSTQLGTFG